MPYKKTILIVIIVLLTFGIIPVTASTSEIIVNEDNLNLRSGPGTNYNKIGQVHSNEKYSIVNQEGDWVEIQLDESTAWVSMDYVTILQDDSSENVVETSEQETITVQFEKTQIRNGPSTDYEIIHFASKGDKLAVIDQVDNWLKIKFEDTEGYVLKDLVTEGTRKTNDGFKGKTIVIDPGHGGNDSGAISINEVFEKDLTYKTAEILAQELSMLGAEVLMTRDKETFVTLGSRAILSNTVNADAFISIHYNSAPDIPSASGISTYYYHDQYEDLARHIHQQVIRESGDRDRGYHFGDFQVIRQNLKPAVLIELGFISNPEVDALLSTNGYQKKLVSGMVNGLQQYFAK
ncbi:N-acetylmuramoyl-L-alanine amidase [Ornithinibacillus sp. 179-J 7C1 HS]|uniref:N-acetylmuramoyl-L-alanine amidase n=1 Tax=Ornithinibacillus sp. 179-J 7C1 HS TaxID=3142384 RepID=UPI0039A0E801